VVTLLVNQSLNHAWNYLFLKPQVIIGNRVVASYKKKVGERIRLVTLIADAKHSWLDPYQ